MYSSAPRVSFLKFSLGLLAVGFEHYGSEEALNENAIMHLFEVYVKVNAAMAQEKENGESKVDELANDYFWKLENGR